MMNDAHDQRDKPRINYSAIFGDDAPPEEQHPETTPDRQDGQESS